VAETATNLRFHQCDEQQGEAAHVRELHVPGQ
jgi:hypothetical protein